MKVRERSRGLIGLVAATALLAAAAGLWSVTSRIHRELVTQLGLERVHVERVQELERAAAAAHVAAIARWVSDNTRRAQRDEQALDALQSLRTTCSALAALVPFDDDEQAAGVRVLTAAALMSNQVQQALYSSDIVGTTSDLELAMETLRTQATAMTATVSRAGSSSDRRLEQLRSQQVAIEAVFVVMALVILTVAVQSLRQRLRESEQMRLVQEQAASERARYFATMSHELRTPLAAIRGFAGNLEGDGARQIDAHAQELLGVINNILDASKLEAGAVQLNLEDVDVVEVIDRCLQRCQSLIASKSLTLRTELQRPLLARADFVKLQQVVTNLVANAIKFTDKGSIDVRAQRRGGQIEIEVEDSGIGIAEDAQRLIWQPFRQAESTTDRRYGGTGLGLSIVRGLVERMGGEVSVDSELGHGSRFLVRLPAAAAMSAAGNTSARERAS